MLIKKGSNKYISFIIQHLDEKEEACVMDVCEAKYSVELLSGGVSRISKVYRSCTKLFFFKLALSFTLVNYLKCRKIKSPMKSTTKSVLNC